MKKLLLLLIGILLPLFVSAEVVEIDGIAYEVITKGDVAVVRQKLNGKYKGVISIPEKILYEGKVYKVTSIGPNAFEDNEYLESVIIPNSVTSIGETAFEGCKRLSSINIPNSLEKIERSVFMGCSALTSINIPSSVISIGVAAFSSCNGLTSINIPSSVTNIESYAFSYCGALTSVSIPSGIKHITGYVFSGCKELTSVTIPDGVIDIHDEAFSSCSKLTDVYCLSEEIPNAWEDSFKDTYIEYVTLHVPATSIEKYREAKIWKDFGSIIATQEGDTPTTQKCATPTIEYKDGKVLFACDTEGVEFVSEITGADVKKSYDSSITLNGAYTISVYATKAGYEKSDIATKTLNWFDLSLENPVKYNMTYKIDGVEKKNYQFTKGTDIGLLAAPEKEGHTFSGWRWIPNKMPAEDVTLSGTYFVNNYTLTYMLEGGIYAMAQVAYGSKIMVPAAPDFEGYVFTGWSEIPERMPAHDVIITGGLKSSINGVRMATDTEQYYDLNGMPLQTPKKGVNIVKLKDGSVVKRLFK